MQTDKKMIKAFKEGDLSAFDSIYRTYSKKLYHFALGLLKDQEISRDLVQEVFVSLWMKRSQVDLNLNFDHYIFKIAYNSILKFFRKTSMEKIALDNLFRSSPQIPESAEQHLIYEELLEFANQTIENLPPRRKMVYKLNKQEGMNIKEIAEELNISKRTAENHLAKALKHLRQELSFLQ